ITYRAEVTSLAARYRVPAVYPFRYFTELGGLLSYGSDQLDNYRRAAGYAAKILNGVKPNELPLPGPGKFQMTINLKTAKALGLDVSLRLQQLADEGDRVKRREFITLLGGAAAWPLAARARAPNAVRHVGVLSPFSPSFGPSPAFQAFRQTFHDLGWIEGRNIVLHYRWAEGHADRLPKLAAELAELKPDLIFSVWGTPSALAAKNATIRIPIVFAGVGDAIGVRLVASLARPGGNVTGSTFISEETIAKQLEFLKEAVPALARVAILVNPANPVYGPILEATGGPAKALDLHLLRLGVQSADD